ncbi:hypothetical protein [Roseimaritima ulvae]|uniref:Outer membrane efflux protein n=1 Tax=Roseimaritima ulvae TaxID=980254 RepID=A0A5B9QN59_9BACT|nr:hypothetical protein [Roseimaritima ulvae]QEG39459.1 hypothetical protein UC8_14540 [Roseimaritima ulvae]
MDVSKHAEPGYHANGNRMRCRGTTKRLCSCVMAWMLCAAAQLWMAPSATAQTDLPQTDLSQTELTQADLTQAAPAVWTAEMVRVWAAQHADGARALAAESRSVGAAYDRDDDAQRKQACLTQLVLAHLAAHDRNRAAAEALSTYYRIVAIEQQLRTLRDASEVVDTLQQLAEKAEQFELPDGDPNALARQGLELAARVVDAEVGIRKLRLRLARLTCQPLAVANEALLSDQLPPAPALLSLDDAIADALAHRRDLQAIEAVCPRISSDTMPAVRSLMGVLQPGLGIGTAVATKALLFGHGGEEGKDVCARRDQCRSLAQTRREQIQDEVRLAELELQACYQRTDLADQRLSLAKQAAREQAKAVELEQRPPGADLLAALESLTVRGELQGRWMEQAVAEVELLEARGAAYRE